jgi:hypothetical protein
MHSQHLLPWRPLLQRQLSCVQAETQQALLLPRVKHKRTGATQAHISQETKIEQAAQLKLGGKPEAAAATAP